jgi:hypothetical protein
MTELPHTVQRLLPIVSPEQTREVRARAWAFVFRCYEAKKNPATGPSGRGDPDGTKIKEDSASDRIIPRK